MTEGQIRIGIDCRSGLYYTARIRHQPTRPVIEALARMEPDYLLSHQLTANGKRVFSVPDNRVITRQLYLRPEPGVDRKDQAIFEMASTLPGGSKAYLLDCIETGFKDRVLGLALNRQFLAEHDWCKQPDMGLMVRGEALGKAYLELCTRIGGDLVCLADFTPDLVSICFIYERAIIGLAHLTIDQLDLGSENDRRKLARDFKTVVNFRLSTVRECGIGKPLSAVVVSGDLIDGPLIGTLGEHFPGGLSRPKLNAGYFADPPSLADIPLESYLVALGLALE